MNKKSKMVFIKHDCPINILFNQYRMILPKLLNGALTFKELEQYINDLDNENAYLRIQGYDLFYTLIEMRDLGLIEIKLIENTKMPSSSNIKAITLKLDE